MALYEFDGKFYEVPDGTPQEETLRLLNEATKPATWGETFKAMPTQIAGSLARIGAGVEQAAGDIASGLGIENQLGPEAQTVRKYSEREDQRVTPKNLNLFQEGALSAATSLAQGVPTALAAVPLMSNPLTAFGFATSLMGAGTGFEKYGESRAAGLEPGRSSLHGLLHGLIEKYTEYLPLKEFSGMGGKLWRYLGKEIVGEEVATALQDLNDKASTKPEMTLGDWAHDAAVTAIATAMAGPLQGAAAKTAATVYAPFIKPDRLTPEQQELITRANALVGNLPPPPVPGAVPAATTATGVQGTPAAGITPPAATPQASMRVDLTDMAMPDQGHPVPREGTVRLYTVIPADGGEAMKGHMTWYKDLDHVQAALDAAGPEAPKLRVPWIDISPADLEASQKSEEVQNLRAELQADPTQYVLPMTLAQTGQYLYNPPPVVKSVPAVETPAAPVPAQEGKPLNVNYTYKFDTGSTKLVFPDEWSKQVFLFAEHMDALKETDPTKKRPITQEQVAKEQQLIAQAYDISNEGVPDMARHYRNAVTVQARAYPNAKIELKIKPAQAVKQNLAAVTEDTYLNAMSEYGKEGEVTLAKDVKKTPRIEKMRALLQKWVTIFAPGTKLVIIGESPPQKPRGRYQYQNGVGMITVPPASVSDLRSYFVLAHEFGHHLIEQVLNAPQHAQAKARLMAEHQALLAEIPNMTVGQYLDRWSGPHRLAYREAVLSNYGVTEMDPASALIEGQDARTFKGYSIKFHEYGAEQFARYVAKNAGELHRGDDHMLALFRSIAKEVRNFYDKVVAKVQRTSFHEWVDGLRANPEAVQAPTQEKAVKQQLDDAYWSLVDDQYAFTLKTLERLPNKDKIRRDTITSTLKRPDVGKQERELLEQVLSTFDGDVIDRATLFARVSDKIVPLTTAETPAYATYGFTNIGVSVLAAKAKTELFLLPFPTDYHNHFGNARYFAHARLFESYRDRGTVENRIQNIVELQSDLAQTASAASAEARIANLEDSLRAASDRLEKAQKHFVSLTQVIAMKDANPAMTFDDMVLELGIQNALPELQDWFRDIVQRDVDTKNLRMRDVYNYFMPVADSTLQEWKRIGIIKNLSREMPSSFGSEYESLFIPVTEEALRALTTDYDYAVLPKARLEVTEAQVHLANAKERAAGSTRLDSLPKKWWEFMLRKLNSEASAEGVQTMRLATADTVARVEGWPKQLTISPTEEQKKALAQFKYSPEELGETFDSRSGMTDAWFKGKTYTLQTVKEDPHDPNDHIAIFKAPNEPDIEVIDRLVPPELTEYLQKNVNFKQTYGRAQGIYDRYRRDITAFVKREFGAKEVWEFRAKGQAPVEVEPQNMATFQAHERAGLGTLNSWLEWDVKPNLENIPVEYYDLVDSVGQTQAVVDGTKTPDAPEISPGFERWFGFFKNSLKLSQMARLLPNVRQLQVFKRMQEERANMANRLMEPANARIREWYDLSKSDSLGIMRMLEDEVVGGVHWTNLQNDPNAIVEGQKKEIWFHAITPRVTQEAAARGVSERAVKVYLGIKNDYLTSLGHAEDTIINSIDYYFRKNPLVANTRKSIARAMFNRLRQVPWLPDRRFGQWVTMVKLKNDEIVDGQQFEAKETIYRSHHRTKRAMMREFAELNKQYGDSKRFAVSTSYMEDVQYAMRGMPRKMIESIPEALLLSGEQMERFKELYYDFSKEGSYLKMLGKDKKRIKGAEQDLRLSYSDYLWRTANLLSKMRYGPRLAHELSSLKRAARAIHLNGGHADPLERLHEYMTHNYNYIMRPQAEWEGLRAAVSMWYLWGVPKSALMNATSIVTTTYPRLAAMFGDVAATGAITKAMTQVGLYWKHPEKISAEHAALFAQSRKDGVTTQSYAAELAAVKDGNAIERLMPTYAFLNDSGLKDSMRKMTWKTVHFGMLPFRVVEEFNRRVTILAAYELEKTRGKAPVTENVGESSAYYAAKETVSITQNEYAPWDRAPFLRGKKSVLLIFLSFVQNMSFFMFGGDKGWWRAWLVLMFLAGWQGLPGAENLTDFLNWLMRKTLDKPIDLRLEARELANAIGLNPDWVAHGAMHSMFGLGWDTASSVGLGRIIPGTDAIFGQGDANRRVMQMAGEVGGPFGGLTINLLQALFDDNPSLLLRFDKALPTLIRNIERGYRGAESGKWTDLQGRPIVDDVTGVEVLGQMMGFSPTSKTQEQEERRYQRETAQYYVLRRQNLLSAMFQAQQTKDPDAIAQAKEKIQSYNAEVPDRQLRITASDITASMHSRERTAKEALTGQPAIRRYRSIYEGIDPLFSERL